MFKKFLFLTLSVTTALTFAAGDSKNDNPTSLQIRLYEKKRGHQRTGDHTTQEPKKQRTQEAHQSTQNTPYQFEETRYHFS